MANKVPRFGINASCIKSFKSTYKANEGSKGCRMRGMTEYQEAEKKTEKRPGGRPAEQEQLRGQSLEQEWLRSIPLGGLGKLCPSVLEPLLFKVSPAKKRQEKDLRL